MDLPLLINDEIGDEYRVTMVESLLPRMNRPPANYTPAVRKLLARRSTMQDVADFVAEYINSDVGHFPIISRPVLIILSQTLGIIAITWLVIADQSTQGIFDSDCLKLSDLHSDAVDYPKSGQPVPTQKIPRLKFPAKPDWNAPETVATGRDNKRYYKSQKAIGRLYRAIDLPAVETIRRVQRSQRRSLVEGLGQATMDDILQEFADDDIYADEDAVHLAIVDRVTGFIPLGRHEEHLIAEVWEVYISYVSQLQTICADHTLSRERGAMLTEEEAIIGTIVAKCSQPRRRKDLMSKMREQTTTLVDAVRFDISGEEGTLPEKSMERAWIAYRLASMEDETFGAKSFGWIAMGEIFDAIRIIEESERFFD